MKKSLLLSCAFILWLGATGAIAYAVHAHRHDIKGELSIVANAKDAITGFALEGKEALARKAKEAKQSVREKSDAVVDKTLATRDAARQKLSDTWLAITNPVQAAWDKSIRFVFSFLDVQEPPSLPARPDFANAERPSGFIDVSFDGNVPPTPPLTLSEIKRRHNEDDLARINAAIAPAAAPNWQPEQPSLSVEAVLVPRQVTVISSSQDGRIADVLVGHGDTFKKGDLLIAYDCADLEAEADIVRMQQDLTKRKVEGSDKLFKLDIISDLDRIGAQVEDKQAMAKAKLYEARLKDCQIRASFDGRVTNRLANAGEYTRTDRVLLEVASNEPLQVEFLVPSKWLRWVNTGAPVNITIGETEKTYTAKIQRIHGEVDPVSQSIQMMATLDPYTDPLLPGMSGQAVIDVEQMRSAGVRGYLEENHTP